MPESLLARRLKLGTYLGIGLYVHWSFALIIAFVAISARDTGPIGIAYAVTQLFGVFLCVTLHEYGHAMAARRFGIGTADITLLPIGGVARLHRMPRIPWQELVVAVAGPAVNVMIVALLMVGFFVFLGAPTMAVVISDLVSAPFSEFDEERVARMTILLSSPSVAGYAVLMLIVNTMLVFFNMIPAFPMDGGRVFRSVLAMVIDYRQATTIASRIGLVCAGAMALFALSVNPTNPIPVLIAAFIGYAGLAEARQVDVMEQVRGMHAGQVMVRTNRALHMDTPLVEIARSWQSVSLPAIPVVSITGSVVGMLYLSDIARAIATGTDASTTAGQLVDHASSIGTVRYDEELESAILRTAKHRRQIPVVDDRGRLMGVLDLDSMLARSELSKRVPSIEEFFRQHFDQVS